MDCIDILTDNPIKYKMDIFILIVGIHGMHQNENG